MGKAHIHLEVLIEEIKKANKELKKISKELRTMNNRTL